MQTTTNSRPIGSFLIVGYAVRMSIFGGLIRILQGKGKQTKASLILVGGLLTFQRARC